MIIKVLLEVLIISKNGNISMYDKEDNTEGHGKLQHEL